MNESVVAVLSRTPPPRTRLSHPNVADAHEEIQHLETLLGLPHGPKIFNVKRANERIAQLNGMVALKGAAAPAVATAPPQPTGPSLATVCEIHSKIFGSPRTDAVLRNDSDFEFGRAELQAANDDVAAARRTSGSFGPALDSALKKRADTGRRIAAARSGNDCDKILRLARDFTKAGLTVPGLAAVGRPGDASTLFNDKQREFAQKQIAAILEK